MLRVTSIVFVLVASRDWSAGPVTAVCYSPSGQQLAAATGRSIVLIDATTGDVAHKWDTPGPITALAFAPESKWLAAASGKPGAVGELRIYSLATLTAQPRVIAAHGDSIYGLAFSADGATIATGSYDRLVKTWNATTGELQHVLKDHADSVYGLAYQPTGKLLASVAADRAIKLWNTTTGKRAYSLTDATDWLYAVAFRPDGNQIAAAGVDKSIRVWNVGASEGKLLRAFFAHSGPVLKLAYSPDGATLISLGEDRAVKLWDATTGESRRQFPLLPADPLCMAMNHDGSRLAIGRQDGILSIHATADGAIVQSPLPEKPKPPKLGSVAPDAVRRGHATNITILGDRLDQFTEFSAEPPGIAIALGERSESRIAAKLAVPSTVPLGPIRIVAKSANSPPASIEVLVDAFDQCSEGNSRKLDATFAGTISTPGQVESMEVVLAERQEVGAVVTKPSQSKLEPILQWSGPDGFITREGASAAALVAPRAGKYVLRVRDRDFRGGKDFSYRLHVGKLPVVTGVFPLGISAGQTQTVRLFGACLNNNRISVAAPLHGSSFSIAVPGAPDRPIAVGEFPDAFDAGEELHAPCIANGRLATRGAADTWRFRAKRGERLAIEALARRFGSPLDPAIEILDSAGQPVEQVRLRCVAKTTTSLRDHPADSPNIRLDSWSEFAINDFVLIGNEVIKIDELPGHPDADCDFFAIKGKRQTYFGTTSAALSMGSPAYKVVIAPPNSTLPPNGYPLVPIYFRNDDGGPGYGKDARILFDPPADGLYTLRVRDACGEGGDEFSYRLVVRPVKPSFALSASPSMPSVIRGQAALISVTADRHDGFDGAIRVNLKNLPTGFSCPPAVIEAGHTRGVLTLSATADATEPNSAPALQLVGEAADKDLMLQSETKLRGITLAPSSDIAIVVEQAELVIRPGQESRLNVRIERTNGFTGRVPIEVKGLPHGVRVLHIGLNGIMITERETTRSIAVFAEPWVALTDVPIAVTAKHEAKNATLAAPAISLRVVK